MGDNEIDDNVMNCPNEKRAAVLAALYNHSRPMGLGVLQARGPLTKEDAQVLVDTGRDDIKRMFPEGAAARTRENQVDFDYLYGRPLKVTFLDGQIRGLRLYDRDNGGPGTARRLIEAALA